MAVPRRCRSLAAAAVLLAAFGCLPPRQPAVPHHHSGFQQGWAVVSLPLLTRWDRRGLGIRVPRGLR